MMSAHSEPAGRATLPVIVAIVGASGAGKSWLATQLRTQLGPRSARLSLDDFYRDRSHLPEARRAQLNFDHPRAIDWSAVQAVLESCRSGRNAAVPIYDFATHTRRGLQEWEPKPVVLMDGLWLLHRPRLRPLFDLKIYLDCPAHLCFERRLARDVEERGRSEASVRQQFFGTVLPMFEQFVAPQSRWADLVLREAPGPLQVQQIMDRLQHLLQQRNPNRV
jgi:uridine kinase